MARDMAGAMASLGFRRFAVAGHDRGGRVAYRMALDIPEVVARLAVLEIAPTVSYWRAFDKMGLKAWHWAFLAQPAPLPETLIGDDARFFLDWMLAKWSLDGAHGAFADGALEAYRAALTAPERVAAYCADYRAGATVDRAHDEADLAAGRTIAAPTLLIAGTRGFPAASGDALAHWRGFAPDVRGVSVECGHFPAEEAPAAVTAALQEFLEG